jgi:hypothetical protein
MGEYGHFRNHSVPLGLSNLELDSFFGFVRRQRRMTNKGTLVAGHNAWSTNQGERGRGIHWNIKYSTAGLRHLKSPRPNPQDRTYKSAVEHWCNCVSVQTYRKLTVPADRILAISGIAERYGRIFGNKYLAGL